MAAITIGMSIFFLLKPENYDYTIQRYRALALTSAILIPGLCIIIGTSKRWFGKDL